MTDKLTWDKKGVERMEYFVAERIAYDLHDEMQEEWRNDPDNLTDLLRCVQGERKDGVEMPDYLRMTPAEAGIVMASMMRDLLAKLLVPDTALWGLSKDAIDRAIKDEDYDREHKEPEEYLIE